LNQLWNRIAGTWAGWKRQRDAWRRIAERRLWLDRWFPHVPLSLAVAPLGLLLIDAAGRSALGASPLSLGIGALMERVEGVELGVLPEFAIGVLFLVMSVGLLLRSRVAWWATVLGLSVSLALRLFLPAGPSDRVVVPYVAALLVLLVINRGGFRGRSVATPALLAIFALLTLLAYQTLATLQLGEHFDPPVRDLTTALYYVVVTISSVGYGEIVPRDPEARRFVIWLIVSGLAVGATLLTTVIVPVVTRRLGALLRAREDIVDRSNHFVIVGRSPLARNTAEELEKRGQRITLILDEMIDQDFYQQRDVVVGDATDLSVLRTAGADRARGVLALSTDDAENGFVVLGVNELAPTVPSVASLNDPKNQFRLKRTQPSLLLSLQVLGGQLLAKALTGEKVESDILEKVLQLHTSEDQDSSV